MWREDFEALGLPPGALSSGAQVVVGGGCDFYPGSAASSPHFSFAVTDLRIAGEGDLLARIERAAPAPRRRGTVRAAEGALPRPALPRTIGVVCGERGKARDDVLAGLERRGWAGRLVWAFAPVQDRHAAPAIGRALTDLAALPALDVVIVARGGGSLADLLAFCDETLCRTVALLRVPVIASVGHHTDRTLIDDVAAVSCSTPTHAAEAAVPLHVGAARDRWRADPHGWPATVAAPWPTGRAPSRACRGRPASTSRATDASCTRTCARCARARGAACRRSSATPSGAPTALARRAAAAAGPERAARERRLDGLAAALAAHDPQRTLARGYALVEDAAGAPGDRRARRPRGRAPSAIRFADGAVAARIDEP